MPTAFVLTGVPLSPLRHSLHAKSRAGWRWPCQVRGRAAAGDVTALFSHFTCLGHARDWLHIDGVRGWGIVAARLDARRVRRGALGLELRGTAASCGYRWQVLYGIPCGNVACAWASIWPMAAAIWAQRVGESTGVEDPEAGFVGDYIDSTASAESEDSSISEGENGHNAEMPSDFEVSSTSGESGDET